MVTEPGLPELTEIQRKVVKFGEFISQFEYDASSRTRVHCEPKKSPVKDCCEYKLIDTDYRAARVIERGDLFSTNADVPILICMPADLRVKKGTQSFFKDLATNLQLGKKPTEIGDILIDQLNGRKIIFLITHYWFWETPSYASLTKSLLKTKQELVASNIKEIAIPRLGCGSAQLEWIKVWRIIEKVFSETSIKIRVFIDEYDSDQSHSINAYNYSAAMIKVQYNDLIVPTLVDTGALKSGINQSFVEKHKIKIKPLTGPRNWVTANGGRLETPGEAEIMIKFGQNEITTNFVVIKDLGVNIILGMDFLQENKALICLRKNAITIGDQELKLEKNVSFEPVSVYLTENVILNPAGYKTIWKTVPGAGTFLIKNVQQDTGSIGIAEGIAVPNKNGKVPIILKNETDQMVLIEKGQLLGQIEPIDENIIHLVTEDGSNDIWQPSQKLNVNHLNADQALQLKNLVDEFRNVFSKNDKDIGQSQYEHEIIVDEPNLQRANYWPVPYAQRKIIEENIQEMLDAGIITRSEASFTSPIVLVKKKDGGTRFCIDFRRLNAATKKDSYPMPNIQEKFDQLIGSKFFTLIDLTSGYWQFGMEENSKTWTSFRSHIGNYQFERMPFGLCNAGATFQRAMEKMLNGLDFASAYIDDVIVYSKTFEEHINHLRQVFSKLQENSLKAKISKCQFAEKSANFLGFIVSDKGITIDQEKASCVNKYPIPKNRKEVKQFIGFTSYYRRFIPNFAEIAEPLNKLTQAKYLFKWTDCCQNAFETLRAKLLSAPILVYPDLSRKFIVITDASKVSIGSVLTQLDDQGQERVICYSSRGLTEVERRYSTVERELLALVWSTKVYRMYLTAVNFEFWTDQKSLTDLSSLKNLSSKLQRMLIKLSEFTYTIKYRPGSENSSADALSRIEWDTGIIMEITHTSPSREELLKEQRADLELLEIINNIQNHPNYTIQNGLLYWNNLKKTSNAKLVVPSALRYQIMKEHHDEMSGGHFGRNKTCAKITNRYFWPRMIKDIINWCESCTVCAARKRPPPGRARHHPILSFEQPFDLVGMDFLGPLTTTTNGNKYIIVFTDYLSRWVEAFATRDMTAVTVSRILINEIICRYGAPIRLLSDQGTNFMSKLVAEVCKYFHTLKINTSAYHPETNGLTERFNGTICQLLSAYINNQQTDWDVYLPACLYAYRTSLQPSVETSPYELLFGREANYPTALDQFTDKVRQIKEMNVVWEKAKESLQKIAIKSKTRRDAESKDKTFKLGELVRIHQPATPIGLKQKLRKDLYAGPCRVVDVDEHGDALLEYQGNKLKWVHFNRLKKAEKERTLQAPPEKPHLEVEIEENESTDDSENSESFGTPNQSVEIRTKSGRLSKKPDYLGINTVLNDCNGSCSN